MVFIKQICNSVFQSDTYLLFHKDFPFCWAVDCGDVIPFLKLIREQKKALKGIFITHTHFDHIYGLNEVMEEFPDCIVYTSAHGKEGLYSDKLNFSRYHGTSFLFQYKNIQILKEGDEIDLFPAVKMEVWETPGHDWSCLTYKMGDLLFTGDSYIPGLKVVASFPRSDKRQAGESVTRILRASECCYIYPGHGEVSPLKRQENAMKING